MSFKFKYTALLEKGHIEGHFAQYNPILKRVRDRDTEKDIFFG